MFYFFLLICGLIGIGIYLTFIMNLIPGAAEERLGVLEALPPDVGRWKEEPSAHARSAAPSGGLVREVRLYFYETNARLVRQVRYRDPVTGEVASSEPEEIVKRRRVRK